MMFMDMVKQNTIILQTISNNIKTKNKMEAQEMILIVIAMVIYFLPSIIAMVRKNTQTLAIFILNLILGWTGLGWVGALVWAFIKENKS